MKFILTLTALLTIITATAQVTNVKAGNWSDNTVWATNLVPTAEDDIQLSYDITIDVNAECLSFNSNGHNVTVKAGANLTTLGSNADTLLAAFHFLVPAAGLTDTFKTCRFFYDSLKRNTGIDIIEYENGDGVVTKHEYASFFYTGNNRWPFKKDHSLLYDALDPGNTYSFSEFYLWQNDMLVADTFDIPFMNFYYQYLPDRIIRTTKTFLVDTFETYVDTIAVTWLNGNMIKQVGPLGFPQPYQYNLTFDSKPNPFYYNNYKLIYPDRFPLYSSRTFVDNVFSKNNALTTQDTQDGFYVEIFYQYRPNGYPAMAYYTNFGINDGYYRYQYTH